MRIAIGAAVACLSIIGSAGTGDVRASIKQQISIPAQSLGSALQALAREREFQIVYMAQLEVVPTKGASGDLTVDEALRLLLEGTGQTFLYADEKTVTIVPVATGPAVKDKANTTPVVKEAQMSRSFWDRFRVAQADAGAEGVKEEGESTKLEEIVVTAQKREERLQDVPISISVLTGDDLDRSSSPGIAEQLNLIPGVSLTGQGGATFGGGAQVAIRGVTAGGNSQAGSSTAAYYLDSVPFGLVKSAVVPDASAYDLERVEVLKGPQGTLYGANALNGVVRVLTKDPDLRAWEFKARAAGSSTEDGGGNYRGDAVINVPIIEDKFAARLAVGQQHWSGWVDSPNQQNVNDADLRTLRLKLSARPTENLSVGLSFWRTEEEYGGMSQSLDDGTITAVNPQPQSIDYSAYGLHVAYDFTAATVTSQTSYFTYDGASIFDLSFAGVPPNVSSIDWNMSVPRVLSQELVITSKLEGPWRWSAGGFYRDAEDEFFEAIPFAGPLIFHHENGSESYAVFGELSRRFYGDKLEWMLGARYFHDDVFTKTIVPVSVAGVPVDTDDVDSFNSTTPRAVLTWYPSENLTVYGSYSQGFRSGVLQDPPVYAAAPIIPAAQPDKLTNYELGMKGALLNGRVSFDAAAFYIKWRDAQIPICVQTPLFPSCFLAYANAQAASGPGIDLAITTNPWASLELGLSAGWNDITYDADVFSGGALIAFEGDRLPRSPEYTAAASLKFSTELGGAYRARFSASANYTSPQGGNQSLDELAPISTRIYDMRASAAIDSPDNRWTVTIYGDNLNNNRATPLETLSGFTEWAQRVRPRTVGLQLEYRFE